MSAGDYRLFRSENAENRSLETGVANSQKPAIGGPFCERPGHLSTPYWLGGAGGFEPPYGQIKNHYLAA